jgi:hypothetical protein
LEKSLKEIQDNRADKERLIREFQGAVEIIRSEREAMQSKNEDREKYVKDKENFIQKLKEESQELLGKFEENKRQLESLLKCQQEKKAT